MKCNKQQVCYVCYAEQHVARHVLLCIIPLKRILSPIPVAARAKACESAAARLLGLGVRIPPAAWISVSCECRVLSGRGLCDGPITCPEESYRVWCVCECDREAP